VGWGVLAFWRIEKALANSLLVVGLWQHDPAQPRLVGFGRCIGDGVIEAVVCDVAIHPHYQGVSLGKRLMVYEMHMLRAQGLERVSLFADPEAVMLCAAQGWQLEPGGRQCLYWHESLDDPDQ
jgi:ribosomal protein S18 acetylase RimI-like enzyme